MPTAGISAGACVDDPPADILLSSVASGGGKAGDVARSSSALLPDASLIAPVAAIPAAGAAMPSSAADDASSAAQLAALATARKRSLSPSMRSCAPSAPRLREAAAAAGAAGAAGGVAAAAGIGPQQSSPSQPVADAPIFSERAMGAFPATIDAISAYALARVHCLRRIEVSDAAARDAVESSDGYISRALIPSLTCFTLRIPSVALSIPTRELDALGMHTDAGLLLWEQRVRLLELEQMSRAHACILRRFASAEDRRDDKSVPDAYVDVVSSAARELVL